MAQALPLPGESCELDADSLKSNTVPWAGEGMGKPESCELDANSLKSGRAGQGRAQGRGVRAN